MKVAISLPDPLFEQAEELAAQRGTSRSQLYAEALAEFVARNAADAITAAIDRVVEAEGAGPDEFVRAAGHRRLRAVEWVIAQGDIWWADLPEPEGSRPGFRRPVLVVQGAALNRSRRNTVVCVPLTSALRQAEDPCHVLLTSDETALDRDSVALTSQIMTLDRAELSEWVGRIEADRVDAVLRGIDRVLGR